MYPTQTAEILKQRATQAQERAERMSPHTTAAMKACRPARGLLGKAGVCRRVPA